MDTNNLNILVISDVHAHADDPKISKASYCSISSLHSSDMDNPLVGIADLIKKTGIQVDWIICPGDLGDKSDPVAQEKAWTALEGIRESLGGSLLIGATGNHDVDSRRANPDFDPKGALQLLSPVFPISKNCFDTADRVYSDRYWSKNFVVVPFD